MIYIDEIKDEDMSRKYKLRDAIMGLEVGQSFTFDVDRVRYMRHRCSKLGKELGRTYSVNKANLSVTRKS